MTQHQQSDKNPGASKQDSGGLAHWGRVTLMLLSFGVLYPNAMTEGMDLTSIQGESEGDLYKKK